MRPVTFPVTGALRRLAEDYASRAALGGQSHVRDADARRAALSEDQVTGQLGQIALHLYWHGHLHLYRVGRTVQDQYPTVGDGGMDMVGTNLDVKTSLVRTALPLEKHHLLVRPAERHPDWCYVQALLTESEIHLMGWYPDSDLDGWAATSGNFAGACAVPCSALYPLPPVRYCWVA